MGGTADRQKFSEALHHPQDQTRQQASSRGRDAEGSAIKTTDVALTVSPTRGAGVSRVAKMSSKVP